jgi:AbiTii
VFAICAIRCFELKRRVKRNQHMLLDEIIDLLSRNDGSLTGPLLKTKVLLHQIGKKELSEWVNKELNGYSDEAAVPPYRVVSARVLANLMNPGWSMQSHPIPLGHLDPDERDRLEKSPMTASVAVIERFASDKKGRLARPIPMEANNRLSKGLGGGFRVQQAWCELNSTEIKNILVNVRSRLLDFLLELRDSIGDVKSEADLKARANSLDTANLFNNAIFGDNAMVIVGHRNIQSVRTAVAKGDFDALSRTLADLGVPSAEICELEAAVRKDEAEAGRPSLGGSTGSWFTRLLGKAAQGAIDIGTDLVSTAVSKALISFIGGPS